MDIVHDPKYFLKECNMSEEVYQYLIDRGFKFEYDSLKLFFKHADMETIKAIAVHYKQVYSNTVCPATKYLSMSVRDGNIVQCQDLFDAFVIEYKSLRHYHTYIQHIIENILNKASEDVLDMFLDTVIVGDEEYPLSAMSIKSFKILSFKNFVMNDFSKLYQIMEHDVTEAYKLFKNFNYKIDGNADEVDPSDRQCVGANITNEEHFKMVKVISRAHRINVYSKNLMMWLYTDLPSKYNMVQVDGNFQEEIETDTQYLQYYTREVLDKLGIGDLEYVIDVMLYHNLEDGMKVLEEYKDKLEHSYHKRVNMVMYIRTGDVKYYNNMDVGWEVYDQRLLSILQKYGSKVPRDLETFRNSESGEYPRNLLTDVTRIEGIASVLNAAGNEQYIVHLVDTKDVMTGHVSLNVHSKVVNICNSSEDEHRSCIVV